MKALFFALIGSCLVQCAASAATITARCSPYPELFYTGNGTGSVSCPGVDPSFSLVGVTLQEYSDYQFGSNGPNTVQVSFTPVGLAGVTFDPDTAVATVTGTESSGPVGMATQIAIDGVTQAAFASPFTVNLDSTVTEGMVHYSSGGVTVVYNVVAAAQVPVPEPALFAMTGIGLLGLIGLARRS